MLHDLLSGVVDGAKLLFVLPSENHRKLYADWPRITVAALYNAFDTDLLKTQTIQVLRRMVLWSSTTRYPVSAKMSGVHAFDGYQLN